jgi:ferredoxin-NADP reductase/anaerobic selenocysteine-containing dehydrogenase
VTQSQSASVPTIEHAGQLEDLLEVPAYLTADHRSMPQNGRFSCSFCGVGDGGVIERTEASSSAEVHLTTLKESLRELSPTTGCVKLRLSMMRQRAAYPIHVAPSVLEGETRRTISYDEAIERLAQLLLDHRRDGARILVYASGQLDYFAIFALQEVFRLLGVRNLTGNAEHCLNAGAVHNEILTGQEGPFLLLSQAITGPGRFYLFNGWNGLITHPPAFRAITARPDFDAFLIEVAVTESAKQVAKQLGKERVLLIRPRADPQLALSVAYQILHAHAGAIDARFIEQFSHRDSYNRFVDLAGSELYSPARVAERIAAEPQYIERLRTGIELIAAKMAHPAMVPINVPSVGLSQTSGVVAHCLWGNVMAMVGKYGLHADGTPAGGTLRIPGQINAESEVQGLSRKYYMGRIPIDDGADAAVRMGLPPDAYDAVARDTPRAALDYSDPTPGERELFLCIGTQFEANMMARRRWVDKLTSTGTTLVVIDPIPDPFSEEHAELSIPSPPHPATTKLYQNGEWKLTLSVPQKRAAPDTRSDATILYDVMAAIVRRLEEDPQLAAQNPDLKRHLESGYLRERFCHPQLTRIDGEVSRAQLWHRIMHYMSEGRAPLYCRPEHDDGRAITWHELLDTGAVYYGGVGTTRFRLDYDDPTCVPFRDIFRRPGRYRFFTPTADDLMLPEGILLNSGRSSLSDERERIAFATSTFNSGKATPVVGMPDEHPLFVSPSLAEKHGLRNGDKVRLTGRETGDSVELNATISDRVKGDNLYISFHKSRAQMERGLYINDLTPRRARCAYSGQTSMKATPVTLERVVARPGSKRRIDTTRIDANLSIWNGQATPLYVTDIHQETHDVFTFRFQGDPLCRFVYAPGQFCSLVLTIDGKKVVRSYSISSSPTRPFSLDVTIKRVPGGLVSNWMPDNVRIGDRIEVSGPRGRFHLVPGEVPEKVLLLGAGSGITPVMSMARWICDLSAEVDVHFINFVRSPDDVIFEQELAMLATRHRSFAPVNVSATRTGRHGWTGMTGRISREMLDMTVPDLRERHVYMCGPQPFMDVSRALLEEMGFPMTQLHSESFGGLRTSAITKAAPLGATEGDSTHEDGAWTVAFARAGKTVRTSGKLPLLDVAEQNDIGLPYGCRSGSCGDCKVRVLRGDVDRGHDDALSDSEHAEGYVLSCVATPRGDCVIEA